ncbi:tudor domain-containing protein 3-like [Tachypleus tridentatus]|uniref:tudor domain-containing protein 3-like n=1 Tax=Tachypleus tridentatus TaxID=6853 RepID=UPI003FD08431
MQDVIPEDASLETPPGTKILLHAGNIQVLSGFLILEEKTFTVLGGHVAHLVEKWEMNRHFSQLHRSGGGSEGGPPPWVNFGQRVDTSLYRNVKGGFRSLSLAHKEPKEDEAFEQQRQANIAEVARIKNEKKKIFGGGKQILDGDIAQVMGKGFSVDQATSALKNHGGDLGAALSSLYVTNKVSGGQNNETRNTVLSRADQNRRREKKNEETDVIQSRPSGPTTLFEFLQNQIPLSDGMKFN